MFPGLPSQIRDYVLRALAGQKLTRLVRNVRLPTEPLDLVALCLGHGIVMGVQSYVGLLQNATNVRARPLFQAGSYAQPRFDKRRFALKMTIVR